MRVPCLAGATQWRERWGDFLPIIHPMAHLYSEEMQHDEPLYLVVAFITCMKVHTCPFKVTSRASFSESFKKFSMTTSRFLKWTSQTPAACAILTRKWFDQTQYLRVCSEKRNPFKFTKTSVVIARKPCVLKTVMDQGVWWAEVYDILLYCQLVNKLIHSSV